MSKKIALVTGGTSGIGRSLLPELVKHGFFVHFVGTNSEKGKAIEAELNGPDGPVSQFIQLDLSDLPSVLAFTQQFRDEVPTLDLLLNVAGVMLPKRQLTAEGFETTFAIGYLSAFLLCRELTPSLSNAENARIANVSGGSKFVLKTRLNLEDLGFEKNYRGMRVAIGTVHAKTVLSEILAEKLKEHGIDVNSFHPGTVKGDLGRNMPLPFKALFKVANMFMSSTSKSGIYLATSDEVQGTTGQLFVGKKRTPLSFEKEYKDELWERTERMLDQALA